MTQEKENYRKEVDCRLDTLLKVCQYFPVKDSYYSLLMDKEKFGTTCPILDKSKVEIVENQINMALSEYFELEPTFKGNEMYEFGSIISRIRKAQKFDFLKALKPYTPLTHKMMLESCNASAPTALARPTPFLPLSKNNGSFVSLDTPIKKMYGNSAIEISGTVMTPYDLKTIVALLTILRVRPLNQHNGDLYFFTDLKEIAKSRRVTNPSSDNVKNAIINSIKRLMASIVTSYYIGNETHKRTIKSIGGIITRCHFSKTNPDKVRIHLNPTFFEMYYNGYVELNPELFFTLKDSEAVLYFFLASQKMFDGYGVYECGLTKLWDFTLSGINKRPDRIKKYAVKESLKSLQNNGVLNFEITNNDVVRIRKQQVKKSDLKPEPAESYIEEEIVIDNLHDQNNPYRELADLLKSALSSSKHFQQKITDSALNKWLKDIKLLVEKDGVNYDDVKATLNWYKNNIDKKYVPKIASGESLRKKYSNLVEAKMNIEAKKPPAKIKDQGQSWHWNDKLENYYSETGEKYEGDLFVKKPFTF